MPAKPEEIRELHQRINHRINPRTGLRWLWVVVIVSLTFLTTIQLLNYRSISDEGAQRDHAICVRGNEFRKALRDYVQKGAPLVVPPAPPNIDQNTVNYIFAILASAQANSTAAKARFLNEVPLLSCS